MFKIIDRYIIKKFLVTFFFMLGVIMILATVFDLADKFSDFIENNASLSDVVFDYYVNFVLFYGNMFSSMIIFVSVIWFTGKMAQNTEIVPIWNSGRSFGRFVRPYMVAATILMVISLSLNHFIIPRSNKVRLEFEEKYYRRTMYVQDYYAEFPGNKVVYFSTYNAQNNLIENFNVEQWNEKGELVRSVRARNAENEKGTHDWVLHDYYERIVGFPNDRIIDGQEKDTTFEFDIGEMATRENVAEAMTYFELKEFIERERSKGNPMVPFYQIELYQRTSYPFATYILTIIGIAVASRKRRGGVGASIAFGLLVVFIYIFAMKVTTVAAINAGLPTVLGVWIPNMLFAGIAYMMYRQAKT